ncbi:MAG: hypothetical protein IKL65_00125 [Bacilli bacterium]|nr:hypothetical protein [Bacilli bacterium]
MSTYRGTPKKLSSILYDLDANKVYELKEYKEQRNKKQNSKYWKLLGELSLVTKIGIEEIHFDMLKNYSQRYEILVPSDKEIRGIDYFEKKSTISKNGKEYTVYHVFTPSHELNESEFAILMKGLIEECKQVGIDVRSPEEIRREEMLYANI